jgi:hypothetical protein
MCQQVAVVALFVLEFYGGVTVEASERDAARMMIPSPLNGERARVKGGYDPEPLIAKACSVDALTPHPQSLSPLRGEGSWQRRFREMLQVFRGGASAVVPDKNPGKVVNEARPHPGHLPRGEGEVVPASG